MRPLAHLQARAVKRWRPGEQAPEKAPGRPQRHTCTARNNAGGDERDETREEKRGEDKEGEETEVRTQSTSIGHHQ